MIFDPNETGYGATGLNPALSSNQFQNPQGVYSCWNLTIWNSLQCGGPLDAPDSIAAGGCSADSLRYTISLTRGGNY